jgi:hypothetical protein
MASNGLGYGRGGGVGGAASGWGTVQSRKKKNKGKGKGKAASAGGKPLYADVARPAAVPQPAPAWNESAVPDAHGAFYWACPCGYQWNWPRKRTCFQCEGRSCVSAQSQAKQSAPRLNVGAAAAASQPQEQPLVPGSPKALRFAAELLESGSLEQQALIGRADDIETQIAYLAEQDAAARKAAQAACRTPLQVLQSAASKAATANLRVQEAINWLESCHNQVDEAKAALADSQRLQAEAQEAEWEAKRTLRSEVEDEERDAMRPPASTATLVARLAALQLDPQSRALIEELAKIHPASWEDGMLCDHEDDDEDQDDVWDDASDAHQEQAQQLVREAEACVDRLADDIGRRAVPSAFGKAPAKRNLRASPIPDRVRTSRPPSTGASGANLGHAVGAPTASPGPNLAEAAAAASSSAGH